MEESLESLERQKDSGYFLMDDLTFDMMRSDEFFSDKTMNMAGEFKEAPSMLERAQKTIAKVKNAYESPVPAEAQERIKAYFAEKIYPRFS